MLEEAENNLRKSPEVVAKATRRRFTAGYKESILDAAERASKPGKIGALLRREGLYSSNLRLWRQQRANGTLSGRKRGRPALGKKDAWDLEFEALQPVNDDLTEKLQDGCKQIAALEAAPSFWPSWR
jgi:transposase